MPRSHRVSRSVRKLTAFVILLSVTVCLPLGARPAMASPIVVNYLSTQTAAIVQPIIAVFNKQNPDVKVVYQNLPFDQLFQQLQVRLSAGSTDLDVLDVDAPVTAAYAVQGFLAPLDSYFSKADLAQFIPGHPEYWLLLRASACTASE